MKHILPEDLNSAPRPVITASGDFSKLNLDGSPIDWLHPDTFTVTYHRNPSPDLLQIALNLGGFGDEDSKLGPVDAVNEIMGGDQNGTNLSQNLGEVIFLADPSFKPEDYEEELENMILTFNQNPEGFESDSCLALLEDPSYENLTPTFLAHCKAVVIRSELARTYIQKYPQYYGNHPEILPGGDQSGIGIMNPRISLFFEVV